MSNLQQLSADPCDIHIKLQTAARDGWWAYYWLGDENAFRRLPVVLWVTLRDYSEHDERVPDTVRPFVMTTSGRVTDYLAVETLEAFVAVLGPMEQSHGIPLGDIMKARGIDISKIASGNLAIKAN